jgi:hypothetical protein
MVLMVPVAAPAWGANATPADSEIATAATATPALLSRRPLRAATSLCICLSFLGAFEGG